MEGFNMALAVIHTRAKCGIEAPAVTVEVHLFNGLPSLSIVGMPETAVKESKDRVRSALLTFQLEELLSTWHPLIFQKKVAVLTLPLR